ncbi:hypothetical protein SNE40_005845 [Patella caerulea]|uniref:Mutator-like transposase domain-containing protein n=1 Tax=Patella caerulea TaxID=87958 RepID=A0AAN8K2C4_PATCE
MGKSKFRTLKNYNNRKRSTKIRGTSGGRKRKTDQFQNNNNGIIEVNEVNNVLRDVGSQLCSEININANNSNSCATNTITNYNATKSCASQKKFSLISELKSDLTDTHVPVSPVLKNSMAGYRLVHVSFLQELVSTLSCSNCGSNKIKLNETGMQVNSNLSRGNGLNFKFEIFCHNCEETIFNQNTSERSHDTSKNFVNKRLVVAARNSGIGYNKLCQFFASMDIPQPLTLKSWQSIDNEVHKASVEAAQENMLKATQIIKSQKPEKETTVSFDGTWHKRGHSSHYGAAAAIDLDTGLVVDTHVASNFCHGCKTKKSNMSDEELVLWNKNHVCQKNFDGSANAMEVECANKIFKRSLESDRDIIYKSMLCDGDSKAHSHVNSLNLYDEPIIKEDCVNHVAKRMYAALDKIKKDNNLNRKLSNVAMKKVSATYATNLKRGAPDPLSMKNAVYGGFFHMLSTDEDPHHSRCPDGINSWCGYNRRRAQGLPLTAHKPTFSREVGELILPAIKRLTDLDLLARCANMKTQNNNESYNSCIWKRCPKSDSASLKRIETAVALATLDFNAGPEGYHSVLQKLGLDTGINTLMFSSHKKSKRIEKSIRQSSEKSARIRRKLEVALQNDKWNCKEGPTYSSGGF